MSQPPRPVMNGMTLTLADEEVGDFVAKVTSNDYLFMGQSGRSICLSPGEARTLGHWLLMMYPDMREIIGRAKLQEQRGAEG